MPRRHSPSPRTPAAAGLLAAMASGLPMAVGLHRCTRESVDNALVVPTAAPVRPNMPLPWPVPPALSAGVLGDVACH